MLRIFEYGHRWLNTSKKFNQDFDHLDGPYVRRHELEVSARSAPIGPSGTNYLDTGKISNLGVKT